jgi:hypothetical protein
MGIRDRLKTTGAAAITALVVVCVSAAPASAADQFTLDAHADSFGPIVTDSSGNGYIAWERSDGSAADIPMFCKLAPDAKSCSHPVALALPGGGGDDANGALALFPILGPGNTVWIVTDRYVRDDTIIWTSTNGGASFGAPYDIPSGQQCLLGGVCEDSDPYTGLLGLDDTDPITSAGDTYNRQLSLDSLGQPALTFLQSATNPGLGFDWDGNYVVDQFEPGISEFQFSDAPPFIDIDGSALGTTSTGDVVQAYTDDGSSPDSVQAFTYTPTAAHPSVLDATQAGFSGPVTFPHSYGPRLADGRAGMFMVTGSDPAGQPASIALRKWNATTHAFGAPTRIGGISSTYAGNAGGLGENIDTGELAVAWPTQTAAGADLMTVRLSTDGGTSFSPAQDVATVDNGDYGSMGSVRVAVSDSGSGFVSYQDERGLQVADLRPLTTQFGTLKLIRGTLRVPVTCAAPAHACTVHALLAADQQTLTHRFHVGPGATQTLSLSLPAGLLKQIAAATQRVHATLTLTIASPGTSVDTLVLHPTL